MIRKRLIAIFAVTTMVAMIQTAQASVTDSLGDLVSSGGSLTIGDKTFSNFGWQASLADASALSSQAAGLTVTASILNGIYYLDFAGALTVNNRGGMGDLLGDLNLTYTVTVNNPGSAINMIDQNYTPNGTLAFGQTIIGETVRNNQGIIVGNSTLTLTPNDLSDPTGEAGDNLNFAGEHQLAVIKDILIDAFAGQIVGLSDVEQSFHQTVPEVPEPTTIIAGALLLLPFGASTLRILRKKRTV
jgi:hypothetical protein